MNKDLIRSICAFYMLEELLFLKLITGNFRRAWRNKKNVERCHTGRNEIWGYNTYFRKIIIFNYLMKNKNGPILMKTLKYTPKSIKWFKGLGNRFSRIFIFCFYSLTRKCNQVLKNSFMSSLFIKFRVKNTPLKVILV